ncbi:hypothetical protein PENTCL1PPCAC_15680 [Pristionchus entomophagus]|uniref:Homeobox domain-containing protein n=1 Tax=Pristionchus entomophagus TaxID=358040 RepID=A0AAV5TE07_9BILA|nr:hypothetical protein PENTCL1PPCAC_15680 [Pristionchus entomophagus]
MQTDDNYLIRVMHVKNANGESRTLQFPMRLDLDRPKRARTTFSEEQLRALDDNYRRNGYVTGEKRAKLAESLELTDTQVKVWFQNRRTKDRKKKGSDDEEPSKRQKNSDNSPSPSSSSSSSTSTDLVPITSNLPHPPTPGGFPPAFLPSHHLLSIPAEFSSLFPFAYPPAFLFPSSNLNA